MQMSESPVKTKRHTYDELVNTPVLLYSSLGNPLDSRKPSAPAFSIPRSDRKSVLLNSTGSQKAELFTGGNPSADLAFKKQPAWKFSTADYKMELWRMADSVRAQQGNLEVAAADSRRRSKTPSAVIGGAVRFKSAQKLQLAPGPKYKVDSKPEQRKAPSYSFFKAGESQSKKTRAENYAGPATYFPADSECTVEVPLPRSRSAPKAVFPRAPRFKYQLERKYGEESYDIKYKSMSKHYDFNYDHGKGKPQTHITPKEAAMVPHLKNQMLGTTFGRARREEPRGEFKQCMANVPATVPIPMPRF